MLYILLIIIAIGVLLASKAGQKLLCGLIGLGCLVVVLVLIVVVLGAVYEFIEPLNNAVWYFAILGLGLVIGYIIFITIYLKDKKKLDEEIKKYEEFKKNKD